LRTLIPPSAFSQFAVLGVNFKGFPNSGTALVSAVLFHSGIIAIAGLYVLFWLKVSLQASQ
jgi:hypothetical protein